MTRTSLHILVVFSLSCAGIWNGRGEAANPVGAQSDKLEIRKVLLSETKDDSVSVDRRAVLQPAEHSETASNAAWWKSAFVKMNGNWRAVEKSHLDLPTALLNEYRAQRDAAPKTAEGQLKLANWCRDQKLTDQERAHLIQVLALSTPGMDTSAVYQRMGYRRMGDHWVSPADFQSLLAKSQLMQQQVREWTPAVERIVRNWEGSAKQQKQAHAELDKIADPNAIPALLAATSLSESLALAICSRLDKIPAFEASQGLASLAVQSESPAVRNAATEHLKSRRVDDFAPPLLEAMHSPFTRVKGRSGVAEPRLIMREDADRYVAVDVQFVSGGDYVYGLRTGRLFPVNGTGGPVIGARTTSGGPAVAALDLARLRTDGARAVDDFDYDVQVRMDAENDLADEYNRRAASTLATISGQEPCTDPRYWWAWWRLHMATQPLPKRIEVLSAKLPHAVPRIVGTIPSCLVAGTPIWTDRGSVAVERIQIGDRVLAKNIDTGEIEYKPVLQTTERPPVPVKRFIVGGEPIIASDGHHFWVSGDGWTKTRELKTGLPIHTVTGMPRVESVEPEPQPAPVYNLVVADFHTYFVGPAMVLSHDVAPPEPTNVKVPGLLASAP